MVSWHGCLGDVLRKDMDAEEVITVSLRWVDTDTRAMRIDPTAGLVWSCERSGGS